MSVLLARYAKCHFVTNIVSEKKKKLRDSTVSSLTNCPTAFLTTPHNHHPLCFDAVRDTETGKPREHPREPRLGQRTKEEW